MDMKKTISIITDNGKLKTKDLIQHIADNYKDITIPTDKPIENISLSMLTYKGKQCYYGEYHKKREFDISKGYYNVETIDLYFK
jgi:hypothetical protein